MNDTKNRPTEAELEILDVLWKDGPSTVRHVHDTLASRKRQTVYTTILKLMQIMHEKKIVIRDESERSHVYAAHVTRRDVQDRIVHDVASQVFGGSAARLAMHALTSNRASKEELEEIQQLLRKMESEKQ